jgi:hypothetical protein
MPSLEATFSVTKVLSLLQDVAIRSSGCHGCQHEVGGSVDNSSDLTKQAQPRRKAIETLHKSWILYSVYNSLESLRLHT